MSNSVPQPSAGSGPGTELPHSRRVESLAGVLDRYERAAAVVPADLPVPATPDWTVRDVTAHLITAVDRYLAGPHGGMLRVDDPQELPRLNQNLLRQVPHATHPDLLQQLRTRVAELVEQVGGYGRRQPSYVFNGGQPVRADRALGILVGELAVHGGDIAAATHRPWPITADDMDVILDGLGQVLPGWVNPRRCRQHSAAYDIRLRDGNHYAWIFTDGTLRIEVAPPGRFDCHLAARPSTLLRVMYRRRSPLAAALTGAAVAWGRRPWLALSLPSRFHRP